MTPAFPKRGPDAGTMDQVRPQPGSWQQTTLNVDWPTYPLSNPIRWRPSADPGQKHDPGGREARKRKEGLTNRGPLQKPGLSDSESRERLAVPRSQPRISQELNPGYACCWCLLRVDSVEEIGPKSRARKKRRRMQLLESSALGLRAALIRLAGPNSLIKVSLFPMVHIGERSFFDAVYEDAFSADGSRHLAISHPSKKKERAPLKAE